MSSFPFADKPDLEWVARKESDVYKDKSLDSLECPEIPKDAAGARAFWNDLKTNLGSIDRTSDDALIRWIDVSYSILGLEDRHGHVRREFPRAGQT